MDFKTIQKMILSNPEFIGQVAIHEALNYKGVATKKAGEGDEIILTYVGKNNAHIYKLYICSIGHEVSFKLTKIIEGNATTIVDKEVNHYIPVMKVADAIRSMFNKN